MRLIAAVAAAPIALLSATSLLAQSLVLPEGTAIRLETRHDLSSKSAKVGDQVELAIAEPVVMDGVTAIPAGAPAIGEVSRVKGNGLLGRSGKLDIRVMRIRAGQVDIPVRGQRNSKGRPGTLQAVGAGVVFLPLAIIVHGKDAKLKAGTVFDVYVDRNTTISVTPPAPPAPSFPEQQPLPAPTPTENADS